MTDETVSLDAALAGDEAALEELLARVQDDVFNLALRMLGTVPDAEDATQEVLIKAITRLSSFRRESSFSTWVYRIALNHLATYRKGLFARFPVSFDIYSEDIVSGRERDVPDLSGSVDRDLLARELKLSCMNGMLQCLDAEGRSAFVLGTMFKLDSRVAADALGITPEAYRKRLSRARARMAEFLSTYCSAAGSDACRCERRIDYAIATKRIDPVRLDWQSLKRVEEAPDGERIGEPASESSAHAGDVETRTDAMERLDDAAGLFASLPRYRCPDGAASFIKDLIASGDFKQAVGDRPERSARPWTCKEH